jgi:hypothetical protein
MKQIFALIYIACGLVSCVTSLYPVTEDPKEIVFKNELLGTWKDVNGSAVYVVDKVNSENDKRYKLAILDHKPDKQVPDTANFLVSLVNIQGHYFFDCMPDTSLPAYTNMPDLTKEIMIPCRYIIKVYSIDEQYVGLSAMDKDAVNRLLTNKKLTMKHEELASDNILLTEKPETLKKKLMYLENSDVYKRDSIVKVK